MSQTIDTLLADVSPLLPVSTSNGLLATGNGDYVYHLTVGEYEKLSGYMRHTANHFPAMLQALRHITMVLHVANGRLAEAGMDNYEETVDFAKQAIAAASEVAQ